MPDPAAIPFRRVNHVTVAVPAGEQEKARAFYGAMLGLEELPQNQALQSHYTLIWYRLCDLQLHLVFNPPWIAPAENRHVALEVDGLDRIRAYLESKGATIRDAVPMPDRERFYLLDPFGNYLELIEFK